MSRFQQQPLTTMHMMSCGAQSFSCQRFPAVVTSIELGACHNAGCANAALLLPPQGLTMCSLILSSSISRDCSSRSR